MEHVEVPQVITVPSSSRPTGGSEGHQAVMQSWCHVGQSTTLLHRTYHVPSRMFHNIKVQRLRDCETYDNALFRRHVGHRDWSRRPAARCGIEVSMYSARLVFQPVNQSPHTIALRSKSRSPAEYNCYPAQPSAYQYRLSCSEAQY